jgi:GTPase SAR1 family protein
MIKPKCIVITGRPGSGKTTLTDKLSKHLYIPKVSRDELKEGYVNTFGIKHDLLPKDTNRIVNDIFKDTVIHLLESKISLIIEAAFDHKIWEYFVSDFMKVANVIIIICDIDVTKSALRHLERGLANPKREYYHGDKRVSVYRETGYFEPGEKYDLPEFDVPTLLVSTEKEYCPTIEEIETFINEDS